MTRSPTTLASDEAMDAPVVRFVNKVLLDAIKRGASDIHFEPYEKDYRVRTRLDGVLKQVAAPAAGPVIQGRGAAEGHGPAGHRRAAPAAGRPHQDEAVEEPRHRFPRQHLPDAVRRKGRAAYPRPEQRQARHRRARLRGGAEAGLSRRSRQALRHDPGDRPHRQRQDRVAVHRPEHPQHRGPQHLHRRGPGGNQHAGRQPGQRQSRRWA